MLGAESQKIDEFWADAVVATWRAARARTFRGPRDMGAASSGEALPSNHPSIILALHRCVNRYSVSASDAHPRSHARPPRSGARAAGTTSGQRRSNTWQSSSFPSELRAMSVEWPGAGATDHNHFLGPSGPLWANPMGTRSDPDPGARGRGEIPALGTPGGRLDFWSERGPQDSVSTKIGASGAMFGEGAASRGPEPVWDRARPPRATPESTSYADDARSRPPPQTHPSPAQRHGLAGAPRDATSLRVWGGGAPHRPTPTKATHGRRPGPHEPPRLGRFHGRRRPHGLRRSHGRRREHHNWNGSGS